MSELVLAIFIIGVGLSVSGMATHLYQGLAQREAALRFDGATVLGGLAHVALSIVCGPYILLRTGFTPDSGGVSPVSVLLASVIAFGWSFMTGLTIVGSYVALVIA